MPTKIKIESLGVYLPPKRMTTEELLQKCVSRPGLDLEKFTGICERRVAEGEYAKDLAVQAAQRALAMSQYQAEDLDVIVCTSISKHNAPDEFSWEPSTAVMVRLGRTRGNRMSHVAATNDKLRERALRMVMELGAVDEATPRAALEAEEHSPERALARLEAGRR